MSLEHRFDQLRLLYELTQAVNRADASDEIYRAAVEGLVGAVAADRASVMIFDDDGVMRYKASKGISDRHRAAMETPVTKRWRRGARDAQAVIVADVTQEPSLSTLLPALANEGIRALALIPLLGNGGLIGKFVLYYNTPHEFITEELQLAQTIATQVAFAAERHLAEAVLRESEERFRRVFEEGPLGITLVGKDYRFLKVNNAFCQMVGYSEGELLQMSFPDITHPDDLPANLESAGRLFAQETPINRIRKRYMKKNGETIWSNLTACIIRDQEGETPYGLAMIEDITEVKRTQEEALVRQKLESLGVLAGGIAHDFNNLLGGILAQAELVETDVASGSEARKEIQRIKAAAIRGSEIVRELMIYAGQDQSGTVESIDLSKLTREMLELVKISISKNAALELNLEENLPAILGNAPHLRQVLMNLVINASEAIGANEGVIRVTTSQVTGGKALALSNGANVPAGDYVQLEVSDTGCGLTEKAKAKIFDPFFTTKFAGRGLGLAVVQGIVRAHGGIIDVLSVPGQGATFQVLLSCVSGIVPRVQSGVMSCATERPHSRTATPGPVLVVEDEELLRLAVSKILRKNGFAVVEAGDGNKAWDLIRSKEDIAVVLLDVAIPGMSSRAVLEEALCRRPDVKVILTSAHSKEFISTTFGMRAKHFIRKPYHVGDVISAIQDALASGAT